MNIVITGAGKGIGFELAKIFTANKHRTFAISRNTESLQNLSGNLLKPFSFDLLKGDYQQLALKIKDFLPEVDILINNAGILINKAFRDFTDDDFDIMFRTNVNSVAKMSRMLLPDLKPGSHIVNISSIGGYQGSSKFPGLSLYSASKGAVSILSEAMAEELKEKGVSVNALALGAVQTEMLALAFPGYQASLKAPEMASFIYDFAINGNKYFNGKIIPVSSSTP
ncbi:MAG: SDR family oxidoreductase [Chlorobi bacterium]|nr:SDR family oxidoreductase [Chlorobiota bacterium]